MRFFSSPPQQLLPFSVYLSLQEENWTLFSLTDSSKMKNMFKSLRSVCGVLIACSVFKDRVI